MASAQSVGLTQLPGYVARPSSTAAFTPNIPALGTMPVVPQPAGLENAPNAVGRRLLANQLASLTPQQNAQFTQIQAGVKQALVGYGGYGFQQDDPNTPQREDLLPDYDASKGMGEREKASYKGAANQANAAGMLESSFANQNIASAVQRTSLEAQQILNQYASAINQTSTDFVNQAANIAGQWASLYGQDAAWLIDNPPPPPPPVAAAPIPQGTLAQPNSAAGSFPTWTGSAPPNLKTLAARWGVPVSAVRVSVVGGKYSAWAQAAPDTGPRF